MKKEIESLDPYQFMAVIGKTVIHPGGKKSTDELFDILKGQQFNKVLDIGCGVGSTAYRIAENFNSKINAVDIDNDMIADARKNPLYNRFRDRITFETGDITNLNFPDNEFDVVIVEAVTMFVYREKAVEEIYRVCKKGGIFIEQEFIWKKAPAKEDIRIFTKELCPGITFDSTSEWKSLFTASGFADVSFKEGPFRLMTLSGFIYDEGLLNTLKIIGRVLFKSGYLKKMLWMMRRIMKIKNKLGYSLLFGYKY